MNATLTLNNGVEMPSLGFGVIQIPNEQTEAAVETALATGYRLIDTAASYFNGREVGAAICRSGSDRSDVFIETKVWISDYGYDQTLHACDKSTRKLGIDRLDLLILHQPLASQFHLTIDAYRALETLLADGRVGSPQYDSSATDEGPDVVATYSRVLDRAGAGRGRCVEHHVLLEHEPAVVARFQECAQKRFDVHVALAERAEEPVADGVQESYPPFAHGVGEARRRG